MALADVYELRFTGTLLNVPWNLVFHALRSSGAYDAGDVRHAFQDTVQPWIMACMSTDVVTAGYVCRSIGDPLDFEEYPVSAGGGIPGGNVISPFAAAAIRFPRKRTDMHHGYKRIPAIDESVVQDGILSAGFITTMQTAGNAIVSNWQHTENPGTTVANYVVVKRVLDAGQYRLPETDGELLYYIPDAAVIKTALTSQNSRKF